MTPSDNDATALAKKLQNPIGDLYSFPFQNNTNFNTGPHKGTQDILNVQPVIPIHINEDWNVITRTILPLIWQPSLQPAQTVPFGTGPTTFSAFLSPSNPINGWLWGVGPVVQIPTISSKSLGSNVWGGGPTGVLVYMKGPWVAGVLANNVWSFGGTSGLGGTRYNMFLTQPFVNYNFGEGWYVGTAPIITANWLTAGNKAWTLPVGAQVGRVMKIGGKLPVNLPCRRLLQRAAAGVRLDLAAADAGHSDLLTWRQNRLHRIRAKALDEHHGTSSEMRDCNSKQAVKLRLGVARSFCVLICAAVSARAADGKPNILVIWGDDIGLDNISAYSLGMMGYQTPNIDRLAKEGALFTDSYAQQSCTAGRASFILGQHPFRTGLLTIGMPGSPQGIPDWAPTIADLLKSQGYATGQFGKNHLGDHD